MTERYEINSVMLEKFRAHVGAPTEKESGQFLQKIIPELQIPPEMLNLNDKELLVSLRRMKLKDELDDVENSLPKLCGKFVSKVVSEPVLDVAIMSYRKVDPVNFRFYFDFFKGINNIACSVMMGEDERTKGLGEKEALATIASLEEEDGYQTPEADSMENYRLLRELGQKCLSSLIKDPTGFSLVDERVRELRIETRAGMLGEQYSKYMMAGANFARNLYKRLYKLGESLYPQNPQK
jgi:hypothetical protein